MKFNPIEIKSMNSYEAGEYFFSVFQAEEKSSKAGNAMLKLELVVEGNGKKFSVYDYLLSTENSLWKLSQFCKSIGQEGLYKKGEIAPFDIKSKTGYCYLDFGKESNDGRRYLQVKYYIEPQHKEDSQNDAEFKDDEDIPF